MTSEIEKMFLPLGSVIVVKEKPESKYFIIARGLFKKDGVNLMPSYLAAPHPKGEANVQETLEVDADHIAEIVFLGYTDDADFEYLKEKIKKVEAAAEIPEQVSEEKQMEVQSQAEMQPESKPLLPFQKYRRN